MKNLNSIFTYLFIGAFVFVINAFPVQANDIRSQYHTFADLKPHMNQFTLKPGAEFNVKFENAEYFFLYVGGENYKATKRIKGQETRGLYSINFSPGFIFDDEGHHISYSLQVFNNGRWETEYIEDFNDIGDENDRYNGGNTKFTEDKDFYRFTDISSKNGGDKEFYVKDLKQKNNHYGNILSEKELKLEKLVSEMYEIVSVICGYQKRFDPYTVSFHKINDNTFIIPESEELEIERHTTSFSNSTENTEAFMREVEGMRVHIFTNLYHKAKSPEDSTYYYNQMEIWSPDGMIYYAEDRNIRGKLNYMFELKFSLFYDDNYISKMRNQSKFLTDSRPSTMEYIPKLQKNYQQIYEVCVKKNEESKLMVVIAE